MKMKMKMNTFSQILYESYLERKNRNSLYSLRAFSRDLGISSGRLTNYLNGRHFPNSKTLQKLCEFLELPETKFSQALGFIENDKYMRRGLSFEKQLNDDEFKTISNWKTWSVYTLFQSSDFEPSVKWFEKKLNISEKEMLSSLNELDEIGLIKENNFFYDLIVKNVTTTRDVSSLNIRNAHKQFIKLASTSIETTPIDMRDYSYITMCIDKNNIPEAKKMIANFRGQLNALLEQGQASELYQLNIQLFPIIGDMEKIQ